MIKYYCDICENEIEEGEQKIGVLDFTNRFINLCPSCKQHFNGAKASIYESYKTQYETLNESYFETLQGRILNNVDPEPVWEG